MSFDEQTIYDPTLMNQNYGLRRSILITPTMFQSKYKKLIQEGEESQSDEKMRNKPWLQVDEAA